MGYFRHGGDNVGIPYLRFSRDQAVQNVQAVFSGEAVLVSKSS